MAGEWDVVSTKPAAAAPDAAADQWSVVKNVPAATPPIDDIDTDKSTWDSALSGDQIRAQRKQSTQADKTIKAIEDTAPKQPGFQHLLWSIVGGPLETAVMGGQSALGERPLPAGVEALGEASFGVTRPVAGALGKVGEGVSAKAAEVKAREEAKQPWTQEQIGAAAKALGALESAKLPDKKVAKAEKIIEKRLNEAPTTAQQAIDKLNAAIEAGDPLLLPDVHAGVTNLAGRMHRAGGAASENIGNALTERNAGAVERQTENINRYVGSGSAYQMFDDLKTARAEAAKPLFEKAQAGGSIAPLETQLQSSFSEASAAEVAATRALQDARNQAAAASAKQTQTGGNVYSTSAANQEARAAEAEVAKAEQALALASRQKQDTLEILRQSQEDRTLGKPGAVWSPLIQDALKDPDIRSGIKRGWEIERNEAFGKHPINATEYAITGYEADGMPIVSKVPTFKLLQVAKEGLDAMLEGDAYRDKFTGDLNKYGSSLKAKQTEYLKELDRLNPDYKPAREQWSGDTANMRALKTGQTALRNKPEINARLAQDMTESERESAKLGLAQTLREAAKDKGPLGAEFKTIAGTEYGAVGNRERIAPFFNNEADLNRFVASVERETTKARTKHKVMGGSQTAEREAEDASPLVSREEAAHAAISAALGHYTSLGRQFVNWGVKQWDRRDPELNAQIARILGSSGVKLEKDARGRIILNQTRPTP